HLFGPRRMTDYQPSFEFLAAEAALPALPGSELDIEFNNIATALGDIQDTLAAGVGAYVYVAYASDDFGSDFTLTFNPAFDYVAIKSTTVPLEPPVASDFDGLWKNYKGAPGATGAKGDAGPTGAAGSTGST